MTSIRLLPENGGEAIDVTEASTVIGRGAFLKVIDKRVSRSHALLEVIDGKLHLTPTHTNPCFYRRGGKGTQQVLKREVRQPLEEGDMFGLLPDQLFYTISFDSASLNGVKTNGESKAPVKSKPAERLEKKGAKAARKPVKKDKSDAEDEEPRHQGKASFRDVVFADGKNMALPLTKKRTLPAWMARLSNTSAPPVKTPASKKAAPAAKRAATSRPASKKRNEDFFDDDEEEDDERPPKKRRNRKPEPEDDFEEEAEEVAPHRQAGKGKRSRRHSDDDEEEEDDSEEDRPRKRKAVRRHQRAGDQDEESLPRRPRRAATKSIGSYEEDFQLLEFDESDDDPVKGDSDSDFKIDDEGDSGSDWDKRRGSAKKLAKKPAGRTRGGRNKRRKAHRGSDSEDDDFDELEEEYVPRPSKRRGEGANLHKGKPADSQEDEEEEEEEKAPKKTVRGSTAKSTSKKERRPCYYGSKCYRRNPDHFKEFSHPGDSDYEGEEESDNEKPTEIGRKKDDNKASKAETVKAPVTKQKKRKNDEDEDDDGLPNTYDYNDSFIDDSSVRSQSLSQTQRTEGDGSEVEEDVQKLKKEAKSFIRNKKMFKPASDDV